MDLTKYPEWFLKAPYRPPVNGPGERDRNILHLEVGRICHAWETLEGELFELYSLLFEQAHPHGTNLLAYKVAYSAMVSASARRDVIEALVDMAYADEASGYQEAMAVLKLVGRAIGRRNDAAHGVVAREGGGGLFLIPAKYAPLTPPSKSGVGSWFKFTYDRASLVAIHDMIVLLTGDLQELVADLRSGVIGPFRGRRRP